MNFALDHTFDLLARTPGVLDRLLRDTSPEWHRRDEGPGTWSAFEVVGHLVHGEETDWIPRARIVLDEGESRPFEPFDRTAMLTRFADWTLDDLLDRFAELRRENLALARGWHLSDAELDRRGRHPDFGPVTLRQLLATWTAHDLNHLGQIARVMAKRYGEEVGPWRAYIGILAR